VAAGLALAALPAQSQSWATYEMCHPPVIEVTDAGIAPFTLDGLQDAALAIPNSTGRYWQITSPEGAVSHLWGTMHVNHPAILALPAQVEMDLRAAQTVALEVDFVFTSRAEYTRWITSADILRPVSDGPSYDDLALPDWLDHWIRDRIDGMGWGLDGADILTPAGVASFVLSDPCADFAGGIYPTQDSLIQTFAAMSGAKIIGLESKNAFLDTLSDPQRFDLTQAIVTVYGSYLNPARDAAATSAGYALYLRGQIGVSMLLDQAYVLDILGSDKGRRMLDLTNGYLVDERNETFLAAARQHLEAGNSFVAVGSFHLPGENGMIEMLRKTGYTVERLPLFGEAP